MQLAQTVSMAFKAISGNKVRAFLTMLGVIIGVMSVIVLIAIGQGTTASVTESISSMGTNLLTVSIQTRRVGGFGGFGGFGGWGGTTTTKTYAEEVAVLKTFLKERLAWLRGDLSSR